MKSVCMLVQGVYDSDPRVRRKAEALLAAGYSVDVLALRPDDGQKTYSVNGVTVHTVALGKKRGSLLRYFAEYGIFFVWAMVRVTQLMRRRRYAVIDVNTLPDFLIFAPVFARMMGAVLVLDMHEITPEFYRSKYGIDERSFIIGLLKFIERISFNFADHVVTINQPVQDLLLGRGMPVGKSTIMMNSADEARFAKVAAMANAGDASTFAMIYHGTLTKLYGLDIAIEAFATVHRDMPNAEIWILGSGPEQEPLRELARARGLEDKVKVVGQVPSSEIPGWLSKATVGLLPIRNDALLDFACPNKLPEFIVMNRPVIISRLMAIRHYFTEDALAYFEPTNVADLAKQMVRVYRDPMLRTRLVAQAREEYRPIRWEVMRDRYLGMIEAVVDPSRHSTPVVAAATTTSSR